jgi:hypothetical protein
MKNIIMHHFKLFLLITGIIIISCKAGQSQSWTTTGDTISTTGDANVSGVFKVGTGTSAISINGSSGTVTSPSQTIGFGNDTMSTSAVVKSPIFEFERSATNSTVSASISLWPANLPNGNVSYAPCQCITPAMAFNNCGFIFGNQFPVTNITQTPPPFNSVFMGIGTASPDAGLSVSTACQNQFSVIAPSMATDVFTIDAIGNTYAAGYVGIGTPPETYPLSVNGTIWCTEVKVCAIGCDFVFDKGYKLMPLEDLEQYLQLNHHLPDIASAKEMEGSDGVALGKMNSQLLQKVEELTLYILQQQKEIDKQNEQIKLMNEKLNSLANMQK